MTLVSGYSRTVSLQPAKLSKNTSLIKENFIAIIYIVDQDL